MGQSITKNNRRKHSNSYPGTDRTSDRKTTDIDLQPTRVSSTTDMLQYEPPYVEKGDLHHNEPYVDLNEFRTPEILFFFDKDSKRICIFDCNTQKWKNQDVSEACFDNETEMMISDKTQFIEEITADCQNYSMIAVNRHTIHIVGKYHIIYDIPQHKLTLQAILFPAIDNPCLSFHNSLVFALSGRKDKEYTTFCRVFDTEDGTWSSLPDLPHSHAYGSAICFTDNQNKAKLMVVGGFESRVPVMYNQKVNVMDLKEQVWQTHIFTADNGIPVFLEAPMIQSPGGSIFILGSRDGGYYKFDFQRNKYIFAGHMIGHSARNRRKSVSCSLNNNNEVFFLADPRVLQKNLRTNRVMDTESEASPVLASPQLDEDATYCIAHFKLGSDPSSSFLSDLPY